MTDAEIVEWQERTTKAIEAQARTLAQATEREAVCASGSRGPRRPRRGRVLVKLVEDFAKKEGLDVLLCVEYDAGDSRRSLTFTRADKGGVGVSCD